jgi:hypothetical protein
MELPVGAGGSGIDPFHDGGGGQDFRIPVHRQPVFALFCGGDGGCRSGTSKGSSWHSCSEG